VSADGPQSQFKYAKPIFDKYGYKAQFGPVCDWTGNPVRLSWSQLTAMQTDGMDIESHSTSHPHNMNALTASQLDSETGGSQSCFNSHGINSRVFYYPFGLGYDNSTVVNSVMKYYDIAMTSANQQNLWFLDCNQYPSPNNQTNCQTFGANGKIQFANRYAIRVNSLNAEESRQNYNDTAVYNDVVNNWLNPQTQYNVNGAILAIPIIDFDNVSPGSTPSSPDYINQVFLDKLLGYLNSNGYQVLVAKSLAYNSNANFMYVKGLTASNLNGTIVTLNPISSSHHGQSVVVTGKLTDQSGKGLSGKTIVFTGTGAPSFPTAITNSDGTFSVTGLSPNMISTNWQVNSIFAGDSSYAANFATQFYNTT